MNPHQYPILIFDIGLKKNSSQKLVQILWNRKIITGATGGL